MFKAAALWLSSLVAKAAALWLSSLVAKAPALRVVNPGSDFHLCRDFSGLSHTSDLKIGIPVATQPGA